MDKLLVHKSRMASLLYHMPVILGFRVGSRGECFVQIDAFIGHASVITGRFFWG